MPQCLFPAFLFVVLIDLILYVSVSKLCESALKLKNALLGAGIGGVYAVWCLLPEFHFLGNLLWRIVFLLLKSVILFGFGWDSLRRHLLYLLLCIAVSGIPILLESGVVLPFAICLIIVLLLCWLIPAGFSISKYVPIQLLYNQTELRLTGLRDTGNTLRDPVTGSSVLVIGADVAQTLTGLTPEQLRAPVDTVETIPGLRLIPFHTVGDNGFLLALQIPNVRIGKWHGSKLVAFAPECVGSPHTFQALIGGIL